MRYRGYGLPIGEIVSEGNVGLMRAVKRFEADRGFRLTTYAMHWIKAAIQDYILRSWSLVKMATTAKQGRLFYNLRKAKSRIHALDEHLRRREVMQIATQLAVSEQDVVEMNTRLHGDVSLNAPVGDEGASEWQDWLVDNSATQEAALIAEEDRSTRLAALREGLSVLNPRERRIFEARQLTENPTKLADLSSEFGVSRERVRQIENRAFEKVQQAVKNLVHRKESARPPAKGAVSGVQPARRSISSTESRTLKHRGAQRLETTSAKPLQGRPGRGDVIKLSRLQPNRAQR